MLFFIDGYGMKPKENVKRICYGITDRTGIGEQISFALNEIGNKDFAKASGIENLEVFKTESFYLVILDVQLHLNMANLISKCKEQMAAIGNKSDLDKIIILDRIFKKDPRKKYVVKKNDNYKRTVMTLELKNDISLLKEYREIHHPENIWAQIIRNMDRMGIQDMEIYLHNYQVFLIIDTDPGFDMEKDGQRWANLPGEKEWQKYVARFQKVDPKSNAIEKWKLMTLIG